MIKVIISASMVAGLLMLGACSSHPDNGGRLRAEMVNGGGDVNGTGKRVCIRKAKTGTHMVQSYCMTPAQYKQYKKEQEESQKMWQTKKMNHDNGANGTGG